MKRLLQILSKNEPGLLGRLLNHPEGFVQRFAAEELYNSPEPLSGDVLQQMSVHPSPEVRHLVVDYLRKKGGGEHRELLERLERESDEGERVLRLVRRLRNNVTPFETVELLGMTGHPGAVPPLIEALSSSDWQFRQACVSALAWFIDDPHAMTAVIQEILKSGEALDRDLLVLLSGRKRKEADQLAMKYLQKNPDLIERDADRLKKLAKGYALQETLALLEEAIGAQETQKIDQDIIQRIEEITNAIRERLAEGLGLEIDHAATASEGAEGHYGSVTMGQGLTQRLEQGLTLEIHPLLDAIEIEAGDSPEEMRERLRVLNFLVHHEMAHVVQQQRKIAEPEIDLEAFQRIDRDRAKHNANEVLLDKIGFDAARLIYVHGDGDTLLDESLREAVSIYAYTTLLGIILRNLKGEVHTLPDEVIVRLIAVGREMAQNGAVLKNHQATLASHRDELYSLLTSEKDRETITEIDLLIGKYREIFRTTLPE